MRSREEGRELGAAGNVKRMKYKQASPLTVRQRQRSQQPHFPKLKHAVKRSPRCNYCWTQSHRIQRGWDTFSGRVHFSADVSKTAAVAPKQSASCTELISMHLSTLS